MKKEDKGLLIDKIKEILSQYSVIYLADINMLDAERTSAFRREAFKQGIKVYCVKNTLLHKAMELSDEDYSGLYPALVGSTALLLSDTGNAPAKLIKGFRKKKETIPTFKAAYVEQTVFMGEENLEALVALKSKNELIADIVALLQSPAKNVVSALQSGGTKLHGVLETLSKKED